ncbi:hypothetical protein Dda_5619 [Drechslerella dactyloides]|uniref:F-box domain-containing protein n=1 Tax=Drechslerella dactyloides TaxID=74499 RepID=A0AAD6NJ21_DREDA|nr:hypothetical protein Dda_5619 [Drechslerella dactyloides]
MTDINCLPNEILLHIFDDPQLNQDDLLQIARVCSLWCQIATPVRFKDLVTVFPGDCDPWQEHRLDGYRKYADHVRSFTLSLEHRLRWKMHQDFDFREYSIHLAVFSRITKFTFNDTDSWMSWFEYRSILNRAITSLPNLRSLVIDRYLSIPTPTCLSGHKPNWTIKIPSPPSPNYTPSIKDVAIIINIKSNEAPNIFHEAMRHTLDALGTDTCRSARFALSVKLAPVNEDAGYSRLPALGHAWDIGNLQILLYKDAKNIVPSFRTVPLECSNVKFLALSNSTFDELERRTQHRFSPNPLQGTKLDTAMLQARMETMEIEGLSKFKNIEILVLKGYLPYGNKLPEHYAHFANYFPNLRSLRFRRFGYLIEFSITHQSDGTMICARRGRLLSYEKKLDLFFS